MNIPGIAVDLANDDGSEIVATAVSEPEWNGDDCMEQALLGTTVWEATRQRTA